MTDSLTLIVGSIDDQDARRRRTRRRRRAGRDPRGRPRLRTAPSSPPTARRNRPRGNLRAARRTHPCVNANPSPPPPASTSSPAWLAVGRMVNVARRMGPGMNSPGGLGHVVRVYSVRTAPDGTAAAADAASGGEGGSITYTVDCVDARPARTSRFEIRRSTSLVQIYR